MELDTTINADPATEPVEGSQDVPGLFGNMFTPAPEFDERSAMDKAVAAFPDARPAAEKPAEPEVPNKEKPDRFEYWQREVDLRKREAELLAKELEQRKQWVLGDCRKGRRPSFDLAAPPEMAEKLYEDLVQALADHGIRVATGRFRVMMEVGLVNDGPVTLLLDTKKIF